MRVVMCAWMYVCVEVRVVSSSVFFLLFSVIRSVYFSWAGWPVSPRDPLAFISPVLGLEVSTTTSSVLDVDFGGSNTGPPAWRQALHQQLFQLQTFELITFLCNGI